MSWNATIGMCAVLFPIIAGLSVGLLRDAREIEAGGDGSKQGPHPPLPLTVFAGIPVAVLSGLRFVAVAHRDWRLEGNEVAVLCAGTGAFFLLMAIDIIRSSRYEKSDARAA